ncbi:acyl carrier protein [Actinoplanes sp. TBRC 11911]|uniref:acyl carrier protein n=1 Tax=Actinoplanes sp. TBRC 11911 TaxID=2729386 RepID=UPI00145E9F05|nr:acyl carrier protein [Actinoplanes sp. TBRC 11911]NMO49892.1 acyl carrier protein [Actinoplanes sp. TBRC 11911]
MDAGQVKAVVVGTLGIEDRAASIDASTPLLGGMPEMDSLAAVELVAALEAQFGIRIEDEDVNAEAFETLGSLTALVAGKASTS